MLTITDIKNINFRKVNLGGYRPEDVDEFIDEVIVSYDQLLKDNAELTKQVEELTQKIEDYRADEDNIRAALMNAQKLGEASIRESKHKSDILLKDAAVKSERIVSNAQREVAKQEEMVDSLKRQISNFKSRLMLIYREHMNLIEALPETEDEDDEMERSRPIERTTRITDVMDEPLDDSYEEYHETTADEDEVSPLHDAFVMPDMDADEPKIAETPKSKPAAPSNIEEVVNPFNSFLSGQKFPVSPVSFGDDDTEDAKPVKKSAPKTKTRPQDRNEPRLQNRSGPRPLDGDEPRPQNRSGSRPLDGDEPRPQNRSGPRPLDGDEPRPQHRNGPRHQDRNEPRPSRDPRKPERPEKGGPPMADAPRSRPPHEKEEEPPVRPSKRRDRGNRRSIAMDMADRADDDLEMPVARKPEGKPPKDARIPAPNPPQKPPRDRDEEDSKFGKLKFGPDYAPEEDDGDDVPMGMFRRRR